ncbi:chorismate mutase aro7 [Nowakowskiella sp. JEL0078]|nr:chorismate mutase aro7 [Nowakowskiella sp. JEL0078]
MALSSTTYSIKSKSFMVRRYTSPDEYPFTKNLPEPILPPLSYPELLAPINFDLNDKIYSIYINEIVPAITKRDGFDGNNGSSATKDVEVLQLLSRRIHMGKFVAEAKFQDVKDGPLYKELIKTGDSKGIMELLTNKTVEERLLKRLRRKAETYGREIDDAPIDKNDGLRIKADVLVDLYERVVIPLTKEVEVLYLLKRLDY